MRILHILTTIYTMCVLLDCFFVFFMLVGLIFSFFVSSRSCQFLTVCVYHMKGVCTNVCHVSVMFCLMDSTGDASLPSSSVDSATDVRASYDDLRRLNRAEHEKKKYDSLSRPSQSTPSVSTAQHSEPLKPCRLQVTKPFKSSQTLVSEMTYN